MHSLIIKSEARGPNAPMAMKPLVVLMKSGMAYFTFNASICSFVLFLIWAVFNSAASFLDVTIDCISASV